MSAAAAATAAVNADLPHIGVDSPHAPRTAHPIPLRDQAFTLHCQGQRSPTIARDLGVPERTVRAWIAAALDELREDQSFSRREQLRIAVERQHALTAAAWQQFEAETSARTALLDAALAACLPAASAPTRAGAPAATTPSTAAQVPHVPATTPAPRYLSLILQALKETNRLLGLYTLARLDLLTLAEPPKSAVVPPTTAAAPDLECVTVPASPIPAESATAIPVASATVAATENDHAAASPPPDHQVPAESATAADMTEDAAESATAIPPTPATAIPPTPATAIPPTPATAIPPTPAAAIPPTPAPATPTPCASVRAAAPVPNPRPAAESATAIAIPEYAAESATATTRRAADSPASPGHDGDRRGPPASRRGFTRRPSRRPILLARTPSTAS